MSDKHKHTSVTYFWDLKGHFITVQDTSSGMTLQSKHIHVSPLGMLAVKNPVLLMKNSLFNPLLEQVIIHSFHTPFLPYSSVPGVLWASSALQAGPPFLLLCGSLHFQSIFAEHILYL